MYFVNQNTYSSQLGDLDGPVVSASGSERFFIYKFLTGFPGGLTSGRRPVVKIIAESLSQHDEKHVVPTPLSVGKGRKKNF
jgi:hypothetical protein